MILHDGQSLEYYLKYEERLKDLEIPVKGMTALLIGYAYWANGFKKEAEYYINKVLEFGNEAIKLGQHSTKDLNTYYMLAGIYAYKGDEDKAYEYLRIFNQRPRMPLYFIKNDKNNPLFDSILDEPEFQQFLQDVEAKYQAEHERVRQWLDENDML